jgi:hypothetical protein
MQDAWKSIAMQPADNEMQFNTEFADRKAHTPFP